MPPTHIWQEQTSEIDNYTTVSVTIEQPNQTKSRLWYRLPSQYTPLLTNNCNPFVVATIFLAMRQGTDLIVHGEVSPSLLQNLAEFQAAWHCWRPQLYQQIDITADIEREQIPVNSDQAIAAFSGGVDASFTMWRHRMKLCGRYSRNIQAGLIIHGFDIGLTQQEAFNSALQKSREMLTSLGLELIPMSTNFREFKQDWEDVFATAIASCLMLLQRGYNIGLIGSSDPYQALNLPYGSNPITDSLLSSNAFKIICDGAAFTRVQKVQEIAKWKEACTNLRVCWQNSQSDKNCGRCEKCIRTILNFKVLGIALPPCFEEDVTPEQILAIKGLEKAQLIELEPILKAAKAQGIYENWVSALEKCIIRNRRSAQREAFKETLKQQLPASVFQKIRQVRTLLPNRHSTGRKNL